MSEYQADVNGAVNIADRYSGESRFREHENDDDSAEDWGGAFDRLTRQPRRC